MKKYQVTLPIQCEVEVWIDAESPEDALKKAVRAVDTESFTRGAKVRNEDNLSLCITADELDFDKSSVGNYVIERKS